jgi:hypothetical protein
MSSASDAVDLLKLDPATWKPQSLHSGDRVWLETNCYIDVWAELLPALGHPAEAALAFTVAQDFEGDHFTFFKYPPEDLQTLFGLAVQEMAIYDTVEAQALQQLQRGRIPVVEVDAYFLADAGDSYRKGHVKTTIAMVMMDPAGRRLGYFHNTGYHVLSGEDYDGLFRRGLPADAMFPYAEFIKRDGPVLKGKALLNASTDLLRRHLKRVPAANPVTAWRAALPEHLSLLASRDMAYFHLYAFNLPRQLGANFEMLGTYLAWLSAQSVPGLGEAAAACRRIAEASKASQFQLARMAHRRKFDTKAVDTGAMEADYEVVLKTLVTQFA